MTTSKFLDTVLRVLPAVQARQITELLNELKASGEIRNASEYQARLRELASLINSSVPKPSFSIIKPLVWDYISSDGHNIMMRAAKNDIEAAFLQTDEIGQKLEDHHIVVVKNLALQIEQNLDEQEMLVRKLERLASMDNEFTLALVNPFNNNDCRVPRSDLIASNLYFDNRTYQNRGETEVPSAIVDTHGKKLLLGCQNDPMIKATYAKLSTSGNSYKSDSRVELVNELSNVIDGEKNTFWYRVVNLTSQVPQVDTTIEFGVGTARDVSYVVIENAADNSFEVSSIVGVTQEGHLIGLLEDSITVDSKQRIDFPKTLVRAIRITFSVSTYTRSEYIVDKYASVNEIFDPAVKKDLDLVSAAARPVILDVLSNTGILDKVSPQEQPLAQHVNYFQYSFGLDNVWFGNGVYNDTGIFVSKPLSISNIGVLAVSGTEVCSGSTVLDTIEYEIIKIDKSPKYKETRFPIPKYKTNACSSERIIFSSHDGPSAMNNIGCLRFCPYVDPSFTDGTYPTPVVVYKNGEQLVLGKDWSFAISTEGDKFLWLSNFDAEILPATEFSNFNLVPPKCWINIKQVDVSAVYTASYTIKTSDSSVDDETVWLDKEQLVYLGQDGKVFFKRENPDVIIDSDIYLQITLRRNLSSQASTPELHEYAVLASAYK